MEFTIGDPDFQNHFWQPQDQNDNCAVAAQTDILNQYLDHPVSLDETNYVAMTNGWYHPGYGTSADDLGNLLQAYGVPCHTVDGASIEQLASELQQGHRVMVGVNSGELWDQGPLSEFRHWVVKEFGLDNSTFTADHVVDVTGLDLSDIHNPQVIINDSGDPNGAGHTYPLDQFSEAWKGSDFYYVATNAAPGGSSNVDLDIGQYMGVGTTLGAEYLGLDPLSSGLAGQFVDSVVNNVDWDKVLANI
jgi:hypothetical protein